ncbi:MAG: TolC family protein [Candidatus Krumholzibacteria bacterium]|nr:TolC family protein [Candidatus Krumholzibacteria bacterium]
MKREVLFAFSRALLRALSPSYALSPAQWFVLSSALFLAAAGAASARELTLEEALALARWHSFELRAAGAEADAARSAATAARRGRYPTLSLEGRASVLDELISFGFEVPPGISFERELGSKEIVQLDAALSLPLYTGGRISGAIDQAEAASRLKSAMVAATDEQVWLAARVHYFTLDRADNMARAAGSSLERTRIAARNVRSMFEAGAADSIDLLEADLAVAEASFALTRARVERRSAEIRLQILLGIDTGEGLAIPETAPPPDEPPSLAADISGKPQLAAASAGIEAGLAEVRISRADYLPSISLFSRYSIGKPNRDLFEGEWDDYFSVGAGLNWSFNLGNRTGHLTRAAESRVEALRLGRERIERDLSEAARLAGERMRLAWEEYRSARERHEITSANYRLAGRRHAAGDLPTNRLLEIEQSLSSSEAALAAARAGYHIARSGWLYAVGSDELRKGTM